MLSSATPDLRVILFVVFDLCGLCAKQQVGIDVFVRPHSASGTRKDGSMFFGSIQLDLVACRNTLTASDKTIFYRTMRRSNNVQRSPGTPTHRPPRRNRPTMPAQSRSRSTTGGPDNVRHHNTGAQGAADAPQARRDAAADDLPDYEYYEQLELEALRVAANRAGEEDDDPHEEHDGSIDLPERIEDLQDQLRDCHEHGAQLQAELDLQRNDLFGMAEREAIMRDQVCITRPKQAC